MNGWQAVVFDLDDTLFPERSYVHSGFRAVARWGASHLAIPYRRGYAELVELHAAGVRGSTFDRWLRLHRLPATVVPELVRVYRQHPPKLRPFPGIRPLLARLRPRCKLGVVSDGYLEVQRGKLAALGLDGGFDAVVFSDEGGRERWKPSPWPFEAVIARLGVAAHAAVYVADNPLKDFLGARRAGLATIWARHSDGDYARLAPPGDGYAPDLRCDSLPALTALLLTTLPV